jgi:hypothetical protein
MPVWGWILLIAFLGALVVGAIAAIVRMTHRLPAEEPLHGRAENLAAPLPLDVADSMTARKLDAEEERRSSLSRDR